MRENGERADTADQPRLLFLGGEHDRVSLGVNEAVGAFERVRELERLVADDVGERIPQSAGRRRLGELDEEFVHESRIGDVFQLGSTTWRIASIEHDRVIVNPAPGVPARMPFWHGEFMARSSHLTARVGRLRRTLDAARTRADLEAIQAHYGAAAPTARSLAEYVQSQRAITGVVPDERHLVLEHFRDEVGSVRMVLHAPFGGRVNAPWGMALARRMRERRGSILDVVVADDEGGRIKLAFFNQAWRERDLKPGRWGLFAGKVTEFRHERQLSHPEFVLLGPGGPDSDEVALAAGEAVEEFAGALIPIYPGVKALPTWVRR